MFGRKGIKEFGILGKNKQNTENKCEVNELYEDSLRNDLNDVNDSEEDMSDIELDNDLLFDYSNYSGIDTDDTENTQVEKDTSNGHLDEQGSSLDDNLFDTNIYSTEEKVTNDNEEDTQETVNISSIKDKLKQVSRNGYIITCTGTHGSGKSTIACNLAYTLGKLGFSVLILDLDTKYRGQHYLTKDNHDSLNKESDNMIKTLRLGIDEMYGNITFVRKNVHMIGSGIACEPEELTKDNNKTLRSMLNLFKRDYQFIICDISLDDAVEKTPIVIENSNELLMTVDSSSWGILSTINYLCNIENTEITENIFNYKTKILFNRYRGLKKVYGKALNVNNKSVLKSIDKIVYDIADCDIGYHFSDMKTIGKLDFNPRFEDYVGEKTQFSDTKPGQIKMLEIINKMFT